MEKKWHRKDHAVEEQFSAIMKKYEAYPAKKAKLVLEPGFIRNRFQQEWSDLQSKLAAEPGLMDRIRLPLEGGDSVLFRYKLLLQDTCIPPICSILGIKEELVLPPGVEVNPESKGGLYWLSAEAKEMLEQARTLMVTAFFQLSPSVVTKQTLPLDLVMATPAYTELCKQSFATLIIAPNIAASKAAFQKQKADLIRQFQM